ncbi:MAG TPA: hypothetical protein VGB98_16050 [Pyrinomonadaceae bacterium]|jgi:hypothetical protein
MGLNGKPDTDTDEEDALLEELREVAHIDEAGGSIVVFASPSETAAIGTELIKVVGGWLLDRRNRRRERAAAAASGGQSNLSSETTLAVN